MLFACVIYTLLKEVVIDRVRVTMLCCYYLALFYYDKDTLIYLK